ncbi:hypothetical protein MMC10_002248 [Thelotrema lepadinum]|nr:hypothetical protein [Thelotrema lepadinum]
MTSQPPTKTLTKALDNANLPPILTVSLSPDPDNFLMSPCLPPHSPTFPQYHQNPHLSPAQAPKTKQKTKPIYHLQPSLNHLVPPTPPKIQSKKPMCAPLLFLCPTPGCERQHNHKLNPCRPVRASTANLPPGTPIHPFMCQTARLATYRVACDACKERWKAGRREERRMEERERRRSRVNSLVSVASVGGGGGVNLNKGWQGGRRATVAPIASMGPPPPPQPVMIGGTMGTKTVSGEPGPTAAGGVVLGGVGSVDPRLTMLSSPTTSNVAGEMSPLGTSYRRQA